jgi:hypothetical protein
MPKYGWMVGGRVSALAIAGTVFATAIEAQECRRVQALGTPPYSAENYPFPLSLRVNLIRMMKREMAAIGRYDNSETVDDGVFHTLLETEIKRLQTEQGEPETGCITWELVMALDSEGREPPPEAVEAFR